LLTPVEKRAAAVVCGKKFVRGKKAGELEEEEEEALLLRPDVKTARVVGWDKGARRANREAARTSMAMSGRRRGEERGRASVCVVSESERERERERERDGETRAASGGERRREF
jgi:hypothetical protein